VSLLEAAEGEVDEIDVSLIGSERLTYCMRVAYHDKVWILIKQEGGTYTFVDQDRIPLDRLKQLPALETHAQSQEALFAAL
jgi:hypothetical protein